MVSIFYKSRADHVWNWNDNDAKERMDGNEQDRVTEGGIRMILVKDLIEWAKQNAIGRSVSYPDGAIRSMDLLRLATDCLEADPMNYKPPKEDE